MRFATWTVAGAISVSLLAIGATPARCQKKDYLSNAEADKIRDADTSNARIKLFLMFASDRIKKLQYEFAHPDDTLHREDRLNALINGYTGCIDDAADLIDLGVEKQEDIHDGIKDMQSRGPGFLTYLKELDGKGKEVDAYKDNLDDALEATTDAMRSADEASKEVAPPPVRRNPA
jgi:hypothetical protein